MDNIIIANNIIKDFSRHRALDDVSLEVPRGQVYGLLGPNGAGKTTLIRIINHITAPDSGTVLFDGHPLTSADIVNIGYLPEERGLYKKMKVGEQAMFFARLKGLSRADARRALTEWFERLDIMAWWDKKVEELSKGMAQKVQFIVTVLHQPKLLIFDEPFSGFDPINAGILKREILRLRDQGATVIFSTHNMASVEELCDNITLINRSRNILSGNVRDIRQRYSDNRYEVAYVGSPMALDGLGFEVAPGTVNPEGFATATISLPTDEAVRAFVAAANSAVALKSFKPLIASMDDIFVRAVEESNQGLSEADNQDPQQ